MTKDKFVAYVSTYTQGDNHGIKIYDVDMEKGSFKEKCQVEITNSSYVSISHNRKYLFSITDAGVESYKIESDGSLSILSHASINGMRGCYVSSDYTDSFLFVAGYHDGKLTVLRLRDGVIGEITDEVYHKGLGTIVERNSRPHINCAKMTHDNRFLLVTDQGQDHINVYKLDHEKGKVKIVDVIRSEIESAPRHVKFSKNGKFVYIVHEFKCFIDVYEYTIKNDLPYFEKIQTVPTIGTYKGNAASALSFSEDYKYLVTSNAGDNSVTLYSVDQEKGFLTKIFTLPISGEYPKDTMLFPNNKFLVSLNHESNNMSFFKVDPEAGTLIMNGKSMPVDVPNCIVFYKLKG
ncbi:MAG: lactonase family protein [Lachnospiraceae bacterium]|nr:lactonase family protein [Lachnospiraceae bacterium]